MNKITIETQQTRSALKVKQPIFIEQQEAKSCRICLETELDNDKPIIQPCKCKGSLGQVHEEVRLYIYNECLKTWIVTQNKQIFTCCEICKIEYSIEFTSRKVCLPRKACKSNLENMIALICLLFIFLGFTALQAFLVVQIVNIFDGNDNNNQQSSFLSSPITMIGFAVIVFLFLVPIFMCLLYVIKKMLFVTKIKSWHILERVQTLPAELQEQMPQHTLSRNASQLLQQLPKLNQTTSILIQGNGQDYEHVQFI
ncbi:unnamed protein product (macronuclear) [Paramecium tetraurelia]|uniref:RING-CH-type domain-containing protein n=1 Tax=Paramecium tetraurelia TaxID=5888 RepID=A0C742_PARTE|nr:uncharacterized protein GSPATT00035739001 [Paramecium tetraurelia]CAK66609.1 unnamed protein product [Paramecium tetraurelia]|eukprot:XP_001434006.1 hypothetical protein (macronuclear) [Paramecium tetraurelia strain d4-2]